MKISGINPILLEKKNVAALFWTNVASSDLAIFLVSSILSITLFTDTFGAKKFFWFFNFVALSFIGVKEIFNFLG